MNQNEPLKMNVLNLQSKDIPKCPKCNKDLGILIEFNGKKMVMPCICDCKKKDIENFQKAEELKNKNKRLEKFKKYSIMDNNFNQCTFENYIFTDDFSKKLYKISKGYCDKWNLMFDKNISLLIHGEPGNGKTYIASCIANELIKKNVSVVAISSIGLLKRIQESYRNGYGEDTETDMINTLQICELLILDDLGAEYRNTNSDWAEKTIYSVIDARYRARKPIIITSNLSINDLKIALVSKDGTNRTYNRLVEMVTIIENKSKSRRSELGKQKGKVLLNIIENDF